MVHALGHVVLALPLIALFALAWPAGVLILLFVGWWLLRVLEPGLASIARAHGLIAGRILGRPISVGLPQLDARLGPVAQIRAWTRTEVFWRLFGWTGFAVTGGLVLSLAVVLAPLGVVTLLILVIVFLSVGLDFAVGFAALSLPAAAVIGLLWWRYADDLIRLRCRVDAMLLQPDPTARLEQRVTELATSRADTVDHSAAELRRIERDLHDGAQARLVALGMNLGLAAELWKTDPAAARRLVDEARGTTGAALGDLRSVVRGIHPPVLADRGLVDATRALALDMALPVTVIAERPGRLPAPVESALYFAIAECLANTGKHAGASVARVLISQDNESGPVVITVDDDGRGGADPARGSGLRGVSARLAAFDGTMVVSSPTGGPTHIILEVPCDWSSPRTTPSFETA